MRVLALVLVSACAPNSVDRVTSADATTDLGGLDRAPSDVAGTNGDARDMRGTGGAGGMGGTGGGGTGGGAGGGLGGNGAGGTGGRVVMPNDAREAAPADLASDPVTPEVAIDAADAGADVAPRVAQLVVGATNDLEPGDMNLRAALLSRGFMVSLRDDGQPVAIAGLALVVIAGSVDSGTVGNKYRDVAVPLIAAEYSQFDDLGMTGATEGTDFGGLTGTQLTIVADPGHPLAGGLAGPITIVTMTSNLAWGVPAASAIRVGALPAMPTRLLIFAYPKGALMAGTTMAPARRVGFFAIETAAAHLTPDGTKLLTAAIDWAATAD